MATHTIARKQELVIAADSESPENLLRRIHALLSTNRRLLNVCKECAFTDLSDVENELRDEIAKLKQLRRLLGQAS
jgi:hypothetical protein